METSLPAWSPDGDIEALRAFKDNYIWLLQRHGKAVVVDPGDAGPVRSALEHHGLELEAILLTHHHADHAGGVAELVESAGAGVRVLGPAAESITGVSEPLQGGEVARIEGLGLELQVLSVPGHTRGHLAYYGLWNGASVLFCGDTLFGAGCGRLFEGSPAQMADSLGRLAGLPAQTLVFCAHEYTAANLRFAAVVEPQNGQVAKRVRAVADLMATERSSVPSTLALELATNPFLRCAEAAVKASASQWAGRPLMDALAVFTALREWKNVF